MFDPNPMPVEIVHQVSEVEQCKMLRDHFKLFYLMQIENQLTSNAAFKVENGVESYLTGIPVAYNNVVFGCPKADQWNRSIQHQLNYFNEVSLPFVWLLEDEVNPQFKNKLLEAGFKEGGVFRGVIGILDQPIPPPEISEDCTLERVETEISRIEFIDLVCQTFGYIGNAKELYARFLWDQNNGSSHQMIHWLARKKGKAVSALTTLIEGKMVSFWNGATLPEVRRQGLSTALRRMALRDAVSRGCWIGSSYLMSEGLAFGICSKFGYQTKWQIHVFLSPK